MNILIIIFIIGILIFYYDITNDDYYKLCNKYAYIILFIHHIISAFLQFGWLSNNKQILIFYLIAIIITFCGLIIFKKCILTIIVNNLCNIKVSDRFRDIFYYLKIPIFYTILFRFFISLFVLYKINYLL